MDGGSIGFEFARGGRAGGGRGWRNGVSSLLKQNKKAKICFVIYIAGFFLKKISVMKCLRSKKRKSARLTTTLVRTRRARRERERERERCLY